MSVLDLFFGFVQAGLEAVSGKEVEEPGRAAGSLIPVDEVEIEPAAGGTVMTALDVGTFSTVRVEDGVDAVAGGHVLLTVQDVE